MKYVVGIAKARPGKRDEFMAAGRLHAERTRSEPGCIFFELAEQVGDPDGIVVSECYKDAEAHAAHDATPYMQEMMPLMRRLLAGLALDMIVTDNIEHIVESYDTDDGPGRSEVG